MLMVLHGYDGHIETSVINVDYFETEPGLIGDT